MVGEIDDTVGKTLPVTVWPFTSRESAVMVAPDGVMTVFPDAAIVTVPVDSLMMLEPELFWIVSFFKILAMSYLAVAGTLPVVTSGFSANAM